MGHGVWGGHGGGGRSAPASCGRAAPRICRKPRVLRPTESQPSRTPPSPASPLAERLQKRLTKQCFLVCGTPETHCPLATPRRSGTAHNSESPGTRLARPHLPPGDYGGQRTPASCSRGARAPGSMHCALAGGEIGLPPTYTPGLVGNLAPPWSLRSRALITRLVAGPRGRGVAGGLRGPSAPAY